MIHTMEEPGSTSKHFQLRVKTRNSLTEFLHGIASLKPAATDVRFGDSTCVHIGLHHYLVVKEKLLMGVLVNLMVTVMDLETLEDRGIPLCLSVKQFPEE